MGMVLSHSLILPSAPAFGLAPACAFAPPDAEPSFRDKGKDGIHSPGGDEPCGMPGAPSSPRGGTAKPLGEEPRMDALPRGTENARTGVDVVGVGESRPSPLPPKGSETPNGAGRLPPTRGVPAPLTDGLPPTCQPLLGGGGRLRQASEPPVVVLNGRNGGGTDGELMPVGTGECIPGVWMPSGFCRPSGGTRPRAAGGAPPPPKVDCGCGTSTKRERCCGQPDDGKRGVALRTEALPTECCRTTINGTGTPGVLTCRRRERSSGDQATSRMDAPFLSEA